MRIAVIGAGAMGSIYGGHLSQNNEVYLVDTAAQVVEHVRKEGIKIQENGEDVMIIPRPSHPQKVLNLWTWSSCS